MTLPHGAVGWYAVCDYDISSSYSLCSDLLVKIELCTTYMSIEVITNNRQFNLGRRFGAVKCI